LAEVVGKPSRSLTAPVGIKPSRSVSSRIGSRVLAAYQMVDGGFAASYDHALRTLSDARFDRWREYDPEDSMRFYALRLHEVGMIKSTPNALLAEGTDWRFLNELKRELKA
jgi:NitT/TauT family transport system substrate-binding protein